MAYQAHSWAKRRQRRKAGCDVAALEEDDAGARAGARPGCALQVAQENQVKEGAGLLGVAEDMEEASDVVEEPEPAPRAEGDSGDVHATVRGLSASVASLVQDSFFPRCALARMGLCCSLTKCLFG